VDSGCLRLFGLGVLAVALASVLMTGVAAILL
jgi:hypothetical protein